MTAQTAVADFFSSWDVYRAVIDNNCMEHVEIYSAIAPILARRSEPFTVLDLGCGDAAGMAPLLTNLSQASYVGVDCAAPALDHARKLLMPASDRCTLHVADMTEYLDTTDEAFDVILVSFALHHLVGAAKRAFLQAARLRLAPSGELLLVDVVRRDGETREQYLDRYAGLVAQWPVGGDRRRRIIEHVAGNDFPEEVSEMPAVARSAGFGTVEQFYSGGHDTQAGWRLTP